MKLSKELLLSETSKAEKDDKHCYIVYSQGEVKIWLNSASISNIKSSTEFIAKVESIDVRQDDIIYNNCRYSIDEFCNEINKQYA